MRQIGLLQLRFYALRFTPYVSRFTQLHFTLQANKHGPPTKPINDVEGGCNMQLSTRWLFVLSGLIVVSAACTAIAGGLKAAHGKGSPSVEFLRPKPQEDLQVQVLGIFEDKCAFAGCHVGANAPQNLVLSEEMMVANLVGVKSTDTKWLRVKPGDPANSYLVKKVRGAPDIKGDRMPRGGKPLSAQEIAAIEAWIKSLPAGMKAETPKLEYPHAFPGITLANLQTAETLEKGAFLYRIAHRFRSNSGKANFDQFFGLDGGARMMTQVAFPFSDDFFVTAARQGLLATYELGAKWRFLREKNPMGGAGSAMPFSAAIYAGVDWATQKALPTGQNLSRTDGERFSFFAQLPVSKQIGSWLSVAAVPGVLLNGNVGMTNEDPLVTLGVAGRVALSQKYALFAEIVPILSGDGTAAPIFDAGTRINNGNLTFNDSFVAGLEIKAGGHVFHIFATNSAGNTTGQYMSGGDLDFAGGDFRLGFNIYRVLNYPL
jgi:hypothetical protein